MILASRTLERALEVLEDLHVVVRADSRSPWIELDVIVKGYQLHRFAIWKATDTLYAEEAAPPEVAHTHGIAGGFSVLGPAMGEDPVDVELLAEFVRQERAA